VGVCAVAVFGGGVLSTRCRGGFDCCANKKQETNTIETIKALLIPDLAYIASVRKLGIVAATTEAVPPTSVDDNCDLQYLGGG
jgi:hypothetical protein